jgi:ornithine carbamoyltransferase
MTQGAQEQRLKRANDLRKQRLAAENGKAPAARFLAPSDLGPDVLRAIVDDAIGIKDGRIDVRGCLNGKRIALLFQKTSTRTRCSFEVGIWDMGGLPSVIDWNTSNFLLSDLSDEIQVISRYYDVIVARVKNHADLDTMAKFSGIPVVNGLSDLHHPCQTLSDYMTLTEYFGDTTGLPVAYVGDGNNVCQSLIEMAPSFGLKLTVATPDAYMPDARSLEIAQGNVAWTNNPLAAVRDAAVIYTDTWVSMGMEAERPQRVEAFSGFQVNKQLLSRAPQHALIMHCLPAHPGEEISGEVLRGPQSIVLDQAENRKYAQMALLRHLLA